MMAMGTEKAQELVEEGQGAMRAGDVIGAGQGGFMELGDVIGPPR